MHGKGPSDGEIAILKNDVRRMKNMGYAFEKLADYQMCFLNVAKTRRDDIDMHFDFILDGDIDMFLAGEGIQTPRVAEDGKKDKRVLPGTRIPGSASMLTYGFYPDGSVTAQEAARCSDDKCRCYNQPMVFMQ